VFSGSLRGRGSCPAPLGVAVARTREGQFGWLGAVGVSSSAGPPSCTSPGLGRAAGDVRGGPLPGRSDAAWRSRPVLSTESGQAKYPPICAHEYNATSRMQTGTDLAIKGVRRQVHERRRRQGRGQTCAERDKTAAARARTIPLPRGRRVNRITRGTPPEVKLAPGRAEAIPRAAPPN
jgi:hypothetical protein